MPNLRVRHSFVALTLLVSLLCQGTWALAGTTGNLSGLVTETGTGTPIANAQVSVTSPSQNSSATTDAGGHFTFLSLAPDSYTVSVEKQGFEPFATSGINVFADQTQNLAFSTKRQLATIGRVTSRSASGVVKPGTTADIYSVNATVAEKAAGLGGGGSLNQAYSAVAAVPGVFIPIGVAGWNQPIFVRGSNSDQTGFEFDGVPVNRAFDNYAAGTLSSLGQQELQVYTGGGPAGASATGLGGFINQVIRTGTYPGFASFKAGGGTPTFYHSFQAEFGGATPNRNFSYYLGFLGADQDIRYVDQFNGGGSSLFAAPLITPGLGSGVAPLCNAAGASGYNAKTGALNGSPLAADPGCYQFATLGGIEAFPSHLADRELVTNFHVSIPHHKDGGKDDVQFLYTVSALGHYFADSPTDLIAAGILPAGTAVNFKQGVTFPSGTQFGQAAAGLTTVPYYYPGSNNQAQIPSGRRDGFTNDSAIFKLQYQKNFGSNAYARVYGYSFYSDWLNNAAASKSTGVIVNAPADYELATHTRGAEFQFADQINSTNLLTFTANYTKSTTTRWNNRTMDNTGRSRATNLVDGSGNCYTQGGALGACNSAATAGTFGNPTPFSATGAAAAAGANWIVTKPGQVGSYNTVSPRFSSLSLTDNWHPIQALLVNAGLKYERFEYDLNSTQDPGNIFWANAAQREACYNTGNLNFSGFTLTCPAGSVHPNGQNGAALYSNTYGLVYTPTVLEPRVAATYTLNADTVLRASYSRNSQPPNTASVQYTRFEPNTPGAFYPLFTASGLANSPRHDVRPAISNNWDFSLEKHFKGTDMSIKITPFVKSTKDFLEDVFLDQITAFVSVINSGQTRSSGVEFEFTKGDFNRDGWAAQLAYTYTDAKIRYSNVGNTNINPIDQINSTISSYNAFTKSGGGAPCYLPNTQAGAASDGAPDPACGSASIANQYYNLAAQPLLDRNGWSTPFLLTPSVNGAVQASYITPHVFSLLLNYKRQKWDVTPSFQVQAGAKYGAPLNFSGLDPTSCGQNQATTGITSALAAGIGQRPDWTSCGNVINVPNYESGKFDSMGQYAQPTQFLANLQIAYDFTPKVRGTLLLSSLINRCFGGSSVPWSVGKNVCGYGLDGFTSTPGISNLYNGTSPNDVGANGTRALPYNLHAYTAQGATQPFQIFGNIQVKI